MPSESLPSGEVVFRYAGSSMAPFFRPGDLLVVESPMTSRVRRGDCIVFRGDGAEFVVHRVVEDGAVLRTRGDARPGADEGELPAGDVVGRVVWRIRAGCRTRVPGGFSGRLTGAAAGIFMRLRPGNRGKGAAVGRFLRLLARPLAARCRRRLTAVGFRSPEGERRLHLMLGGRPVGIRHEGENGWRIFWPYDLLFRDGDLPPAGDGQEAPNGAGGGG